MGVMGGKVVIKQEYEYVYMFFPSLSSSSRLTLLKSEATGLWHSAKTETVTATKGRFERLVKMLQIHI